MSHYRKNEEERHEMEARDLEHLAGRLGGCGARGWDLLESGACRIVVRSHYVFDDGKTLLGFIARGTCATKVAGKLCSYVSLRPPAFTC